MKKTPSILIVLLMISLTIFSQNETRYKKQIEKENSIFFGISSLIMAPSIIIFSKLNNKDYYGKTFYGAASLISVGFGVASLYNLDTRNFSTYSLFGLAGISDAFSQELLFHYTKVKQKMPFLNDNFFDPSISWKNKYIKRVPFSNSLLIGTTDGYHAFRSINKILVLGGIISLDNKTSIRNKIKTVIISSIIYTFFKGGTHFIIQN